jgi:hypothetical protein
VTIIGEDILHLIRHIPVQKHEKGKPHDAMACADWTTPQIVMIEWNTAENSLGEALDFMRDVQVQAIANYHDDPEQFLAMTPLQWTREGGDWIVWFTMDRRTMPKFDVSGGGGGGIALGDAAQADFLNRAFGKTDNPWGTTH